MAVTLAATANAAFFFMPLRGLAAFSAALRLRRDSLIALAVFILPPKIDCFALGAWRYGEGQGTNDMVGLTMGTGIGAGIIIGGKLYNGVNTGAGEIGSLPFKDADYEFYCSSRFFYKLHGDTGANFGKRAQAGDEDALAVWQEFGENVGELIKAVLFTYAPEAIIIGGGIANAFSLFETAMRKKLESFPYPENVAATRILPSTLPNAAMLGASVLH